MFKVSDQVIIADFSQLTTHPIADRIPLHPEDHPEIVALVASLHDEGQQENLHCNTKGEVFEGRHRLIYGHKLAGIDQFKVIVEPDDVAATKALHTALARRSFNQGQKALIIVQLFDSTAEERKARSLSNLKKSKNPQESPTANNCPTMSELAALHGVSETYLKGALRIAALTNDAKRDKLIARIMAGEVQLGAAVAGLAGGEATAGAPKKAHNYFKLLGNGFSSLKRFGKGFRMITNPREAAAVVREAEAMADGLPEPLVKAVLRGCKERLAELKKS